MKHSEGGVLIQLRVSTAQLYGGPRQISCGARVSEPRATASYAQHHFLRLQQTITATYRGRGLGNASVIHVIGDSICVLYSICTLNVISCV